VISGARITALATATALNTASGAGQRLKLKNTGANAIDLGDSAVTDGAGYEMAAADVLEVEVGADEILYAISAAAQTNIVEVLTT